MAQSVTQYGSKFDPKFTSLSPAWAKGWLMFINMPLMSPKRPYRAIVTVELISKFIQV